LLVLKSIFLYNEILIHLFHAKALLISYIDIFFEEIYPDLIYLKVICRIIELKI